jgi:hypothetical protein
MSRIQSSSQQVRRRHFSLSEAQRIGKSLGLDWKQFDAQQFWMGLNLELQRGWYTSATHLTNADPVSIARIVVSRLRGIPDYYTRLGRLLQEAGRVYGPRLFAASVKNSSMLQ